MTVQASRPARSRQAVIFRCNAGCLPFALHAAGRIDRLTPGRAFDICICHGEEPIVVPDSLSRLDVRLIRIDTTGLFTGLRPDPYLRLALPQALAADYDRIHYLDSDIFVQGGDFTALLGLDPGNHPRGAVRDNIQWRTPGRRAEKFRGLPISMSAFS
ncbi:glycosyltransferase [Cereibacter johrii]|uniref:glycosyltransferase n=1 Tax=Cereibacter johrii TaxID=445629 RepID=UPI003CECBE98